MSREWRRRASAFAVVAITVGIAWAAGGALDVEATPRIIGIRHQQGSQATGTVMLSTGSGGFTGKITYNCGPPPAIQLLGGTGDPLSILPNTTLPVLVECPASLGPGMHRCKFNVENSMGSSAVSFDGFCETFTQQGAITAAPMPVTFINQQVGVDSAPVPLVLTNNTGSSFAFSLQVDNDNFLVGFPCQNELGCDDGQLVGGSNSHVDVICRSQSSGVHAGRLFIIGENGAALLNPIDLSCSTGASGSAVLTLSPPDITLQPIEVNNATSDATITLTNAGTSGSITITSISIAEVVLGAGTDWTFTVDGACTEPEDCVLLPMTSLDVRLTFDPSGFNSRAANLIVNYIDAMGTNQASAALEGDGRGATLELVTTTPIDFGTIPLGSAATPQTFTLRNQGNRLTTASLSAAPAPFLFPLAVAVAPGEQIVTVGCMSNVEVEETVQLSIDGPDATETAFLQLHCDVRDTAIVASPTSIPYGERRVGVNVAPQTVTIERVGPGAGIPLSNASLASDPPHAGLSLSALSPLVTPATTVLSFTPVGGGALSDSIVIAPMTGASLSVPVTGNVVTVGLAVDDVMTLGTFCVGQPTSPTSVSLTSFGTATVQITEVALAGGLDSPFALEKTTPSSYPTSIPPLVGKATVLVTPKRSDIAEDEMQDTLVWATDDGDKTSTLTAKFIADGGAIAPDIVNFGDVPIRIVAMNDQGVTLQNCSTSPLQLITPTLTLPFKLTNEFPLLLDPAAKVTFTIAFEPTEVGMYEQQLAIESMGGDTFTVTLRGNGVIDGSGSGSGSDGDRVVDETSFYACGCRSNSNPSSVLMIALGVIVIFRRRRSPDSGRRRRR